jgi:hypothetical protein
MAHTAANSYYAIEMIPGGPRLDVAGRYADFSVMCLQETGDRRYHAPCNRNQ